GIHGTGFNWVHDTMDPKMTCDLIDEMFLSIKNSVWLPQHGFEMWSNYYLQRKGLNMEQIKTFLKCFNAVIKEKLVFPDKRQADPSLVENLTISSQFLAQPQLDKDVLEVWSGSSYNAAQDYWAKEFSNGRIPTMTAESVPGESTT